MIYLWKNPSFPDAARSSRPFVKRLASASAMSAMDIDDEATAANSALPDDETTAANNGHPANLLQISFQEVTLETQMALLFGADVPVAEYFVSSGRIHARF